MPGKEEKVFNPRTKKWVLATGKVGKSIIKEFGDRVQRQKGVPPVRQSPSPKSVASIPTLPNDILLKISQQSHATTSRMALASKSMKQMVHASLYDMSIQAAKDHLQTIVDMFRRKELELASFKREQYIGVDDKTYYMTRSIQVPAHLHTTLQNMVIPSNALFFDGYGDASQVMVGTCADLLYIIPKLEIKIIMMAYKTVFNYLENNPKLNAEQKKACNWARDVLYYTISLFVKKTSTFWINCFYDSDMKPYLLFELITSYPEQHEGVKKILVERYSKLVNATNSRLFMKVDGMTFENRYQTHHMRAIRAIVGHT